MRSIQSRIRRTLLGCVGICLALATPASVRAQEVVAAGYDLFETIQPTDFLGFQFEGIPIGPFDFGGTIGVRDTGFADTIVRRQDPATVGSTPNTAAPIDIELVALHLVSASPIDLGAGQDFHYITLDPAVPSTGQMTITFDDPGGGIFNSFINVDFDVRISDPSGPVLFSDVLRLSADDVPWDRIAPPPAVVIPGVNHQLNGQDNSEDFWPGFPGGPLGTKFFTETHPSGARHSVANATPEPATLAVLGLGALALLRRRRKASA